jgi:hypothetical protein
MVVGKIRSLPRIGAPERCFTLVVPGLATNIRQLEKLARDKYSSLLQKKSVNYDRKKFYSTGPAAF